MTDTKNRDTFFGGVLLLTLAAAAAKICGVLFKIPLHAIIGDEGMGYFNSAYVIYTFFYVFTTSGLPVGLSIVVRDAQTAGQKRLWRDTALVVFGVPGALLCLAVTLFPRAFSLAVGNQGAEKCIFVMGPALLFVCLEGVLRGYFQGKRDMLPTALSQVIEAVFKTGLGLAAAGFAAARGYGAEISSAWALSGITAGSFLGLIYLSFRCFLVDRKEGGGLLRVGEKKSVLAARLLRVVVPVSMASVVISLSSVIDLSVVMHRLRAVGHSAAEANRIYGNYSGLAIPFFNMPSMLIAPIASALVPHLRGDPEAGVDRRAILGEAAIRLTLILSFPCAILLGLLSDQILPLFFDASSSAEAAPLLTLLAPSIPFVSLTTVTGAYLQATGRRRFPVFSLLCGAIAKIAVSCALMGALGIAAAPLGTLLCNMTAAIFNLALIAKKDDRPFCVSKTFAFPFVCAALCAAAVGLSARLTRTLGPLFCTAVCCAAGGIIYCLAVLRSGCIDGRVLTLVPALRRFTGRKKGMNRYDRKRKRTHKGTLQL